MKHFYGILFLDRNFGSNEKLFPPFQVCGNNALTERSLPPNFGACFVKIVTDFANISTIDA